MRSWARRTVVKSDHARHPPPAAGVVQSASLTGQPLRPSGSRPLGREDPDLIAIGEEASKPSHVLRVGSDDNHRSGGSLGCFGYARVDDRDVRCRSKLRGAIGGGRAEDVVTRPREAVRVRAGRVSAIPTRFDPNRGRHDDRDPTGPAKVASVCLGQERNDPLMLGMVRVEQPLDGFVVEHDGGRAHAVTTWRPVA